MRNRQFGPPDKAISQQVAAGKAVPRGVAKAIQFMRENLAERLNSDALASASGLSERSMRRQFRCFTGQSPAAFHRGLRLEAARKALRVGPSGTNVTATAADHGFSHFGHFASRYREYFGEFPSDTQRSASETVARPGIHIGIERLSVAVLPFSTDGGGPLELTLAGAATDSVILCLGHMRWLDVVVPLGSVPDLFLPSLHSARYAIRGCVRRLGLRTQVTVRLFEIATGRHIWGNAFEDNRDKTQMLLDRVAVGTVGALSIRLRDAEATRAGQMPLRDRTAHNLIMRAFQAASTLTANFNAQALEDLDRARALDPSSSLAVGLSAWCRAQRAIYNFAHVPEPEQEQVRRLTALALSLNDEDSLTLAVLGNAAAMVGALDQAELLIGKCLALDPYCAMAWQRRGWIAIYRGRYTALADFKQSLRLGREGSERHNTLLGISATHFGAGRYDLAADWAMRGIQQRPSAFWAYRIAAVAQARCGRQDEAQRSTMLLQREYPDLTVSAIVKAMPMQVEFLDRFAEAMESAGLPV